MKHVIVIPNYLPPSLNQLLGHWSKAYRLKCECEKMISYYAGFVDSAENEPLSRLRRRVSLTLTMGPRNRQRDPDNCWKAVLDALVKCGLLVDDSPHWCVQGDVTFLRGPDRETRIELEDVE